MNSIPVTEDGDVIPSTSNQPGFDGGDAYLDLHVLCTNNGHREWIQAHSQWS